ncbi:MAG: septation regulator SpoVG [Hydrogenibacillus schlegelii]|uniref:Putative septation protein SpoVG n=1 Tax=Hydrogenibacillus schlegelii TaxID=1484 RepID=A0A947CVU5_HYDSH|nr:septation regulator SpoVG [Hydrogenibacillus schlegelii]MBT9282032.1 septation regulator SpoVG [Hydrogenibacillus schlegelii]
MEVTDVRIRTVQGEGKMKAVASVTFDGEFVVHDIRIIDGTNGLFVAMPSKRMPDGAFRDIAHPISSATREKIQRAVLDVYRRHVAQNAAREAAEAAEPTDGDLVGEGA